MILLLGKNDLVENYADSTLHIDMRNDIVYYPNKETHHTELYKYVNIAKEEKPPVITTQNLEMINVLLDSDLDFSVYTVYENNKVRKMSKQEAINASRNLGIELRWIFDFNLVKKGKNKIWERQV